MDNKKILYVDYDLQVGHVNFNHIHIDALMATGAEVRLVLHKYMFEHLPYPEEMYDYIIPTSLRYRDGHPILNRIIFIITLLLIKLKVNVNKYDKLVVGYCDEISLYTFPLSKGMYIFMHKAANVKYSKVKRWLCTRLSRKNSFLVFNRHMGDMLAENGITNYHIVSHGCIPPFCDTNAQTSSVSGMFNIFHPSAKLNKEFIDNVLKNENVQRYLEENNVQITLKTINGVETVAHKNIHYLPTTIDFNEYKRIFVSSDAILISYPPEFCGQVSGISFECVANKKRAMIFKHPSLEYCKDFYNYEPDFCNEQEFIALCENLRTNDKLGCTISPEHLMPNYSFMK